MIKTKLLKQVGEVSFKNDKIYPNIPLGMA